MDFASIDYVPVSPYTPLAILAILIVGLAAIVLIDRWSHPRLSSRNGLSETTEQRNAPAASNLGRLAEREVIGALTASHMIRRRFQIG